MCQCSATYCLRHTLANSTLIAPSKVPAVVADSGRQSILILLSLLDIFAVMVDKTTIGVCSAAHDTLLQTQASLIPSEINFRPCGAMQTA